MAILHNTEVNVVLEVTHRTPGNLRAFVQARIRNLLTGLATDVRFSSTESVERVTLEQHTMQYLYKEGDDYHFMNTETYDQITLDEDLLGDAIGYLRENEVVQMQLYEGRAIGVDLPPTVVLTVKETTPGVRGDTVNNTRKDAVLDTGISVKIPLFIAEGEKVRVDTRTGEFVERVND